MNKKILNQQIFPFARVGLYGGKEIDASQLKVLRKRAERKAAAINDALKPKSQITDESK